MREIKVSGSRLSVLKANPLFAREVEKFRKQEEDKYQKALEVFSDNAEKVAQQVVDLCTGVLVPPNVKLAAGQSILDRLAVHSSVDSGKADGDEVVFEQLLRVTKRGNGKAKDTDETFDASHALAELNDDIVDLDDEDEEGVYSYASPT